MKLAYIAGISMVVSGSLIAQDVTISGTISQTIKEPINGVRRSIKAISGKTREIKLLKVELSPQAKQVLASRANYASSHIHQFAAASNSNYGNFPPHVQLGMNGVPVLNQGNYGTCVTFATTAATDAVLKKGDYVSQLCQLQVGSYLAANGYGPSGWDGSFGRYALSQMDLMGIVSKEQERTHGCGGLQGYPSEGSIPQSSMTPEEFHQISEPSLASWSPLLDIHQVYGERIDTKKTLADVKASLIKGDRVTFAVLLIDLDLGIMGAVGSNKTNYDSWVLTEEIARDVYLRPEFGGHEMVITGYDDNAVALDDKGEEHRGLLTLRNSWGDELGDHGDFYMSYDYFKLLVIEAQRIRLVSLEEDR